VFLIGGWVANDNEWDRFSTEWTIVLQTPPAIRYFSHHESKAAGGQFEGWTPQQIEAKAIALTEVICHRDVYGIISGLNLQTHASAFKNSVLPKKQLQSALRLVHPYQWCFFSVIAAVLQAQLDRGGFQDTVDFVFDQQKGLFKKCAEFYREFKSHMPAEKRAIAGTVGEASDREVPALQAADLLVGQVTTNLRVGKPELPWRRMAIALKIMSVKAYPPGFENLPDLVSQLNVIWSTKRLADIDTH
jgi:hypothetical protein